MKKKATRNARGTQAIPSYSDAGRRLGRPPMAADTFTMAIRAPAELVDALDAYVKQLAAESPWSSISRSDAARRLMMRALFDLGLLARSESKSEPEDLGELIEKTMGGGQ